MPENDEGGPGQAAHARTYESLRALPRYQPSPAADLAVRFRVADHLAEAGLYGDLSAHILFGPESGLNACFCLPCRYREDQDDTR